MFACRYAYNLSNTSVLNSKSSFPPFSLYLFLMVYITAPLQ